MAWAVSSGNPISAFIDLILPEKHLVQWELATSHLQNKLQNRTFLKKSESFPKAAQEKIQHFLKSEFQEDLSELKFVEVADCSPIGAWGSKYLDNSFILFSPAAVTKISEEKELSDISKFLIQVMATHLIQDDLVEGEIKIAKQSAKWRLLSFAAVAVSTCYLVYNPAADRWTRISSLFTVAALGSMAGSVVDYFYRKNMRQQSALHVQSIVALKFSNLAQNPVKQPPLES
jgi:hypothetical protein